MDIAKRANFLFGPTADERDEFRVSMVIVAPSGKCLAVKRSPNKKTGGGTWGGPGGHIDPLENFAIAAVREAFEETGITVTNPRFLGCQIVDGKKYVTFAGSTNAEHTPQLDAEHTAYKWVKPDNWPQKIFPGFAPLLKEAKVLAIIKEAASVFKKPATHSVPAYAHV